ncbi:hypothetical protein G6F31_017206 [Rhizopus arrhizus]|nr:hypothetical protein G6F31_017206 [Rhizopus arrhizus]
MQFQTERPQADVGQPTVHDFQRRHFFGHEQHGLAARQKVRDQIGDGLALAGARRAFQHQVAAGIHGADGFQLRRVGQQRGQQVLRLVAVVQPVKARIQGFLREGLPRMIDQVLDDAVGFQLLGTVLQVLPHQILGERENPQVHLLQHFPASDLAHGKTEGLQHAGHVHALVVGGQDVQARDAQRKPLRTD